MDRQQLKQQAEAIFEAGLRAVDPHAAVTAALHLEGETLWLYHPRAKPASYDLTRFERVIIVGAGKASACMALAAEEVLGERLDAGLVVVKDGHGEKTRVVEVIEAAHPVPDARGEAGARRIKSMLEPLGEETLVLSLISGGGSALMPLPAEPITLAEKQALTSLLLAAGADIGEINTVRKHISALKGGQLARCAAPATIINLMLSDVVGDRLDVIASGPAVPDRSTFMDARSVLERYALWEKAPAAVRARIEAGVAGEIADTPKVGDRAFARCANAVIGSNIIALRACEAAARAAGFNALVLASTIEGETRDVARTHAAIARQIRQSGEPLAPPACVISGGETTVTLRGQGKGGRNQEFALAAAFDLVGLENVAIFSAGTDGTDGPTDAAGAIAFGDTLSRAREEELDADHALAENDAYPFFEALGDLLITGPTGTNVMDVHLILVT